MDCQEPLEGRPAVRLFENRRRAGTDPTADACTRTPPERHPNAARMSPERLHPRSAACRTACCIRHLPRRSGKTAEQTRRSKARRSKARRSNARRSNAREATPAEHTLRNTPRRSKTRRSKTRGTNPQKQPRGRRGRQRKIILISETFPLMRDAFFAKRKHPIELLYTFVLRGGVSPGE